MKRIFLFVFTIILVSYFSFSQKETYNWYFGFEAGLTFNTSDLKPKPLLDGAIGGPTSLISSLNWQSCVMSDSSGNLLFYSDGVTVWDFNHQVIPFGKNIHDAKLASGHKSIITNFPLKNDYYFLFTNSPIENDRFNQDIDSFLTDGIRYSIIEITKDKEVRIKQRNQLLNGKVTNHLLAVKHRNGRDFWVITHEWNSNRFISYLIDEFGIHDSVFSSVGTIYRRTNFIINAYEYNSFGNTKSTVNGRQIASANRGLGIVEIFDFDNSTGMLSNPRTIKMIRNTFQNEFQGPEGVEFSPDGKKIYVSFNWYNEIGQIISLGGINQYDFSRTDIASILKSEYLIKHDSVNYYAIQLGADGKIYNARFYHTQVEDSITRYLDVIENPNEAGKDCNYKFSGFYLCDRENNDTNHFTRLCLPQFIMDFMVYHAGITGDTSICEDETLVLKAVQNRLIPNATYQWKNSKGQILSFDSLLILKNVTLDMEGYYYLHSEGSGFISDDSIYVIVHPKPVPTIIIEGDSIICSNSFVKLTAENNDLDCKYYWSTGEKTNSIFVDKEGKYVLKVVSKFGCEDSSFVLIRHLPLPKIQIKLIGDTVLCRNDSTLLIAEATGIQPFKYKWNTGSIDDRITVKNSGIYKVEITDSCGLMDTSSIEIFKQDIQPYITQSARLCEDSFIVLSCYPISNSIEYIWSNGQTAQSISVNQPGRYSVIIKYNKKCSDTAYIDVVKYNNPIVSLTGDSVICSGTTGHIKVEQDFISYKWEGGETTKEVAVLKEGLYKVEVEDSNGCIGNAQFFVKEFQFVLNGISEINFGKVYIGSNNKKILKVQNLSNNDINISRIFWINNKNEIKIKINKTLPFVLMQNETFEIEFEFMPIETGIYIDSLIVETDNPCTSITKIELRGEAFAQSNVWIIDTTGFVGKSDFCIPVKSKFIQNYNQPVSYSAKLKFDASAFLPDSDIISYVIDNNRYIELSGNLLSTSTDEFILNEFCGRVLFADNDITPLIIENLTWSDQRIETQIFPGSLTLGGICARNIARIRLIEQIEMISPNPASDYIEINVPRWRGIKGVDLQDVAILDLLGTEVLINSQLSIVNSQLRIDVSSLSPGVYFLRVSDVVSKFVKY